MPDEWESPWYAAWDLAFHMVAMSLVDSEFAKDQLLLFCREWYMHPNGQLPAYEWAFDDVNPPVHAWAVWRVFKIDAIQQGKKDWEFLERMFHKLLMNFSWWVNRKDAERNNRSPLKVRPMVGLIPLFAVESFDGRLMQDLPEFRRRAEWFIRKRPEQCRALHVADFGGNRERHFLALVGPNKLRRILNR